MILPTSAHTPSQTPLVRHWNPARILSLTGKRNLLIWDPEEVICKFEDKKEKELTTIMEKFIENLSFFSLQLIDRTDFFYFLLIDLL